MKKTALLALAILSLSCRQETDPPVSCQGRTCSGHGTCGLAEGEASCTCEVGFAGADCSACADGYGRDASGGCIEDGPCTRTPQHCGEHGVCDDRGGALACVCDLGWSGETCTACAEGYAPAAGDACQRVATTCTTQSCSGHGWCADETGSVVCACLEGYEGAFCDGCAAGFHLTASGTCEVDRSCAEYDPCGVHGTCTDAGGIVGCSCATGWGGAACIACAAGYHDDGAGGCAPDESCPTTDPCAPNGSCDDSTGVVTCVCSPRYAGPTCAELAPCASDADCDPGTACVGFACVQPVPDPDAYATEAASRDTSLVWSIEYPALYPQPESCCFDYNGDGAVDDGLGSLLAALSSILGVDTDVQARIDAELDAGTLVRVIDWTRLPAAGTDGSTHLSIFEGALVDPGTGLPDLTTRRAGLAEVRLDPASFGPHGALSQLNDGRLESSVLTARGDRLRLPLLFFGELWMLTFEDLRIEGPLARGATGATCEGLCSVDETRGVSPDEFEASGLKVGATLPVEEFFGALDSFYRACTCRGLDPGQPVLEWTLEQDPPAMVTSCTANLGTPDACTSGDPCADLDMFCSVSSILSGTLDVDRDNDGINDAFGVGLRFGISGTQVLGLAP